MTSESTVSEQHSDKLSMKAAPLSACDLPRDERIQLHFGAVADAVLKKCNQRSNPTPAGTWRFSRRSTGLSYSPGHAATAITVEHPSTSVDRGTADAGIPEINP
jgi:hypothetical protein